MNRLQINSQAKFHLRHGYRWVFSNELREHPRLERGSPVELIDQEHQFIAWGYYNPDALIAVRVMDIRPISTTLDNWLYQKLDHCRELREYWYPSCRSLRFCYSESDGLPGLIIDRYEDYFVIQLNTAGIRQFQQPIIDYLLEKFNPSGIILRSDHHSLDLEQITETPGLIWGKLPSPDIVWIEENGIRFAIPLVDGQKTGFFYDQRENRNLLRRFIKKNDSVLDVFSYTGAWGLYAAHCGAHEITFIDRTLMIADLIRLQMQENGFHQIWNYINEDAFESLKSLKKQHKLFDCIILDPPAFIKSRKKVKEGLEGYYHLNLLGMQLLKPGGILVSCSCSYHLREDKLIEIVQQTAHQNHRTPHLLHKGLQAYDHPISLFHSETQYLKSIFFQLGD